MALGAWLTDIVCQKPSILERQFNKVYKEWESYVIVKL